MAKKKKGPTAHIGAVHAKMAKAGPMKHRNDKRRSQKERRYDQESEL